MLIHISHLAPGRNDAVATSRVRARNQIRNKRQIMARYAVIDVGTNSIKFLIVERQSDGSWRTLIDRAEIARLGDGFYETGNLCSEAMTRNANVIADMVRVAHEYDVDEIIGVGTMCLRSALNAGEFILLVQQICGVTLDILSGEEEARLAFLAATSGHHALSGRVFVFDTGGGSTECIIGHDGQIEQRVSLNIGALLQTEQSFATFPVSSQQIERALQLVELHVTPLEWIGRVHSVVGIGGTVTTLCAVKLGLEPYNPERIEGATLELSEIDRQIALYASTPLTERQRIPGLHPQRADVILGGAIIVKAMMLKTGAEVMTVSDRGLRHGILSDRIESNERVFVHRDPK